jgi:DNA-directed RNA polymerase specialized sigma24 family protein
MIENPLDDSYAPAPGDEQLAALGTARDAEALSELVRRHQRWIYNLALRILQSPADAEDASQEVPLKLVTRLSTFRGEAAFHTWAYRIAHTLEPGGRR